MKRKVLYLDIETGPSLGWVWSSFKTNVIGYQPSLAGDLSGGRHGHMLCFSYLWEGQKVVKAVSQPDFPAVYEKDRFDDTEVVKAALNLLDEADIVIGHNIDRFDLPAIRGFAVKNGLPAPSPFRTVDTLKIARSTFRFKSNSLKNLAGELGLPAKQDPGGFNTWLGCLDGNPKAWKRMVEYAKHDTRLLPLLYERMRPFAKNMTRFVEEEGCPHCGVEGRLMKRGFARTNSAEYQRWQCMECLTYSRSRRKSSGPAGKLAL